MAAANLRPFIAAAGLALSVCAFAQPAKTEAPKPAPKAGAQPDLKTPTLYVVGYAHLDTQWRWTYQDSIREFIPNTLHDNFKLFEKYPHYVFNFSGSRRYQMMKEYYPEDYKKLTDYVKAGRWFPCGSSVDENDANVPSAESLIRHVLYGNRYFRHEFGVASEEYMLPDCFGFPAALPSVLAHCGVKGFSTQKLTWNAVIPIPFKVGVWEGPDGHSVVAALDPGEYVGDVKVNLATDQGWLARINNNGKQSGVYVDYHYFGTGDQGGAPRDSATAKVEESVNTEGPIKVISAPADAMVKAITPEQRAKLPTYKGELELVEHSSGSISSEAYMKRWNRKNELLADAAERASVAAWWLGGSDYPSQRLENAWYLLLGSQMHDILPGTSVPKAYDFSWNDECLAGNQFSGVVEDAVSTIASAMDTRATSGSPLVVYNALSTERDDVVEADIPAAGKARFQSVKVTGPDGKQAPAQLISQNAESAHIAFLAHAPSVGFAAYSAELSTQAPAPAGSLKVSDHELENESLMVKLDQHGDISSIKDKKANKEVLSAPARLELHYENPRNWPAWNQDWADRQLPVKSFAGESGSVTFKVVENGPARVAVQVTREAEGSTFTQTIRLASGSPRVEVDNDVAWRTRERSLRASFPLTVSNSKATYDIQSGAIERPNSSAKQFEYSFHQWFDLTSEKGDYGVTVMSDSKYASDKPSDNTVRLTLLHTPGTRGGYPDQGSQDLGRHHTLYAIEGHQGGWQQAATFTQAQRLNQPLQVFTTPVHDGPLGKTFSLAHTSSPAVSISAIKKAEDSDEVIIRLREQTGSAAKKVHIALAKPIVSAREVDGQERELAKATLTNGELVTDIGGYELRAFALKLGEAPAKLTKSDSAPVTLPFDTAVATTRENLTSGAMDDQGRSYPAEMLPSRITDGDITFTLGNPAGKNAVACQGQEIKLPGGNFNRLYILAAATNDIDTTIDIDGKPAPFSPQCWNGYVGQWDHREWPGDTSSPRYSWNQDPIGLEPGYVKPDHVAWFSSHYNTRQGNTFYEYCYMYKYGMDIPAGAKSLRLPSDSRVKIFAMTLAKEAPRVTAAAPLFDTLADRAQDAPRMTLGGKPATDAPLSDTVSVKIEPSLYWSKGGIRFTTDGANPTDQSSEYTGQVWITEPTTLKAAVVDSNGHVGPVASVRINVNDTKGPSFDPNIGCGYQSNQLHLTFSELIDKLSVFPSNFQLEPAIEVKNVSLATDGYHLTITLATPPKVDTTYKLTVSGIKDYSPKHNTMEEPQAASFKVGGPVYTLDQPAPEQFNKPIKADGLPVKAKDNWTINMWVKTDKQPAPRTVIAGFGECAQAGGGNGRYICRFPGGLHFWSHNQDAPSRTALDLDRWQMLTATYDGQTLRMYKDGQKVAERGVGLSDDQGIVNIAPKDPWDHERQFSGEIRGFTIWNSALGEEALRGLLGSSPK